MAYMTRQRFAVTAGLTLEQCQEESFRQVLSPCLAYGFLEGTEGQDLNANPAALLCLV